MKVLVISGFLGAGKTTFLKHLVKFLPNMCILENDYASANIDKMILEDTGKQVYGLDEGCICCSKKSDFASSIWTISNSIDPEFLVIEPTGVGYLSKVMENIQTVGYERISLLKPITIVDYPLMEQTIKDYGQLFWDQIAHAGHILFSKTELIPEGDVKQRADMLQHRTKATIHLNHYSTFTREQWLALLEPLEEAISTSAEEKEFSPDTLVYAPVAFPDFQALGTTFQAVSEQRFGRVLRGKGIVRVAKYHAKVDLVQGSFQVEPVEATEDTRVVFVGQDLDKRAFDILFGTE